MMCWESHLPASIVCLQLWVGDQTPSSSTTPLPSWLLLGPQPTATSRPSELPVYLYVCIVTSIYVTLHLLYPITRRTSLEVDVAIIPLHVSIPTLSHFSSLPLAVYPPNR